MTIIRNTAVISVSLPKKVFQKVEEARREEGETRSNFIRNLIERYTEDLRWERIYRRGAKTARKFDIKNESDIDKILHAR